MDVTVYSFQTWKHPYLKHFLLKTCIKMNLIIQQRERETQYPQFMYIWVSLLEMQSMTMSLNNLKWDHHEYCSILSNRPWHWIVCRSNTDNFASIPKTRCGEGTTVIYAERLCFICHANHCWLHITLGHCQILKTLRSKCDRVHLAMIHQSFVFASHWTGI